ncbi:YggS family pyridoxal phosphate-dependent enzyme [Leptospira gomenensis]|uniref:YggS family pyridoxal phosphate-dependent enzyme n=1 Tax=Leptospira gomenensis TaxID=2484974 RepID=A0A5F1Y8K2_9LEPT|nr:YggS family pyridoxal phosphate-dependent enzyme [Leptospira gomenensis]TGK31520.1 YggS family pyridoxal phosphate-dependent enzyme [Leptospira gomenensis]TGK44170.1 YggS family pyridoxal phosphate-dependent enzyme [Leptospira gomenensis]TGK46225.1 YggS family pyridoxal phosphate-dependent enzyme [Leptospira gomenensis]TGK54750.1 YggS family pyridoxal phosphate-dependent enzyme [Leptospira gomenensis]
MGVAERYFRIQEEFLAIRPNDPPVLIAVSKFQPWEKIKEAVDGGVIHFGENRVQEGLEKFAPWIRLEPNPLILHHIGPVQSGTLRKLFSGYSYTHGVGTERTISELASRAEKEKKKIGIFLQANLTGESAKHGFVKRDLISILEKKESFFNPYCVPEGMMTMGPSDGDPVRTREVFRELRIIRENYFPEGKLSMGMSGDYRIALEEGSDFVRIGSAIFGERN